MKFDRLLSIVLLLQTRRKVTARELAERLEVSQRTIYRDLEALSAAGVPVYAERGSTGGIALVDGFRTDVTGLTADEARALFVLASQSAHSALGLHDAWRSALRKVMAALPDPHRPAAELTSRRILVEPERWRAAPARNADVETLYAAVESDRRVRIRYRHGDDPSQRTYTVDPYGLVAKSGTWYLVADHRGKPRLYRADRVTSVSLAPDAVRRRPGVELIGVWAELRRMVEDRGDGPQIVVSVRRRRLDMVTRIAGGYFTAPPAAVDGEPDRVHVTMTYPVVQAVRQLLQFGTDVEILEPPEARAELARASAEIATLYAGSPTVRRATTPCAAMRST
ncbi:helix-turn-helix transcriptional regulator [Cellulomonas telluris]|uniref:helix-turn-helix transcriptional regulator n=1 Tax=Cellulomonas telluris TaxID=2306636 RepID=UPI0010A9136F|nr:YafY family protein [Cellulomonas telluris]